MGKPGPGSSVTSPSGTSHSHSNSIDKKPSIPDFRSPTKPSQGQFNTAPPNTTAGDTRYVNEFGERKKSLDIGGTSYVQTIGATGYGSAAGAGMWRQARALEREGMVPCAGQVLAIHPLLTWGYGRG